MAIKTNSFYTVGTTAKYVGATPDTPKRIHAASGGNLHYSTASTVSTSDTQISAGSPLETDSGVYLISASSTHVMQENLVVDVSDRQRGESIYTYAGAFKSGPATAGGVGAGVARTGAVGLDTSNGVVFVNEGTQLSPYWTPLGYDQAPLFGINTDFRSEQGEALTDTDAEAIIADSGLRVFGEGVQDAEGGAPIQTAGEGNVKLRLTTGTGSGDVTAIGSEAGIYQPDQHQLIVVDTEFTHVSAITNRATFVGFIGTAADALAEPVTGGTTTATFVQDDVGGVFQDTGFTDADGFMLVAEKDNAAGTQVSLTAAATMSAAATFQRVRVEVGANGVANAFFNKAWIGTIPGATGAGAHSSSEETFEVTEELSPVLYIAAQTTAAQSMDVKRFATWAYR